MTPETMILEDGSEIATVHFLATPLYGLPRIACMPGLQDFASGPFRQAPLIRTDEVKSVNCPLCKLTADFKERLASR